MDLSELLRKADDEENISLQMSCMGHMPPEQKVIRNYSPYVKRQTFQQRISETLAERCNYCGVLGVHIKGRGCPAYSKRCYKCNKRDHLAVVCRTRRYIKEIIYINHRIIPETSILKKTKFEARSKEVSEFTISIQSVVHFTKMNVKQREETKGIYQKKTCTQPDYKGMKGKSFSQAVLSATR